MLRSSLIYLSKADWARRVVTEWDFAWKAASRFVAGDNLEDAVDIINQLNVSGINTTLDCLGEHITTSSEANTATQSIIEILDVIDKEKLRSNVSIKLSQIGIEIDFELCVKNTIQILQAARDRNNFVRIDMEDSPWVEKTLELIRRVRDDYGYKNNGVVIQAYLYRSIEDVVWLAKSGIPVRLCKGAYKEPADIAFPKKTDVDKNFDKLSEILIEASKSLNTILSSDGRYPPLIAVASHDPDRLLYAKLKAQEIELPKNGIEFQMLYGIRRDLQQKLAVEGYPVRVYVPFGSEWYPYFVRRLAERPANVWFFISNYFKK